MIGDVDICSDEKGVADTKKKTTKSRRDIKCAKRTSQILSNYRAFLQEHEMETAFRASADPLEDGFHSQIYGSKSRPKKLSVMSAHGGVDGANCLLRDFSMPDVPLGSDCDGMGDRHYNYAPTLLRSKRVKYGVFMSAGLLIVCVAVTMATTGSSNKGKMPARENTPGWHSEAAYVLDREHGDKKAKLPYFDAIAPKDENLVPEPNGVDGAPMGLDVEANGAFKAF